MEITVRRPERVVPSYSLTGDLLSYLKCGLQYRYTNRGSLPPSRPVQLWFGEFLHAVMEAAFVRWVDGEAPEEFPWDWREHIRPIELEVAQRLAGRGLRANPNVFSFDDSADPRPIASRRTEASINTWAKDLFPLISRSEVRLTGARPTAGFESARSPYYEVTGIVDVLGSLSLQRAGHANAFVSELMRLLPGLEDELESGQQFEVILDYKGTSRPSTRDDVWRHYEWQVLTYAWLRMQQPDASKVVAGVLFFLTELEPTRDDLARLKILHEAGQTDAGPVRESDVAALERWSPKSRQAAPKLSAELRRQRCIRAIAVDEEAVVSSLARFDRVVDDIETSVAAESSGARVIGAWTERPSGGQYTAPDRATCTACDFKYFCPLVGDRKLGIEMTPMAP